MEKRHSKHRNQVRITGGSLRGRKLSFQAAEGLRPTPDSVRERLFNWLGQDLTGQTVLDLFAGSGALGFEAASRYARNVWLCDTNPHTVHNLKKHIQQWQLTGQMQVSCQDGLRFLRQNNAMFDLVLLDPPFAWQDWAELFDNLQSSLKTDAKIYLEAGQLPQWPSWLSACRQGKAGQSQFVLLDYIGESLTQGI